MSARSSLSFTLFSWRTFSFSWLANEWNLDGSGCRFESCPRAGRNKRFCSSWKKFRQPLPPWPCPFALSLLLSPHPVRRSQKMALWLFLKAIVDGSLQGQDAVVRPLLKKSLLMMLSMSLLLLGWTMAACSTGMHLWSYLGNTCIIIPANIYIYMS